MTDDNKRDANETNPERPSEAPAANVAAALDGRDDAANAATTGDAPSEGVAFDALGAAAELDAILSADDDRTPVEKHGESYDEILEAEVAALNALVAQKDAALQAAEAEHEKSRARVAKEAERRLEQRTRKILLGFIEVLDNLNRALASAREVDHNPAVIDGVELVHKSFIAKLGSFGVTHKPALGELFDPNVHDAISVMSTTDDAHNGRVMAVVQEGYIMGEDVLRPAGVVVGKKSG